MSANDSEVEDSEAEESDVIDSNAEDVDAEHKTHTPAEAAQSLLITAPCAAVHDSITPLQNPVSTFKQRKKGLLAYTM